jgi:hypothetical protein
LLELCIDCESADHMLDQTIGEGHEDRQQGWWVKKDRIDRVNAALSYIQRRKRELDGALIFAESQSDAGQWFGRDDWYGTCDVTIRGSDTLEVMDYKDGRMFVKAEDNSQLISYAVGKLGEYVMQGATIPNIDNCPIQNVRMTIVQPKTTPMVRYVDMPIADVWEAGKRLAVAAKATDDPNAPLVPSDDCKWCKHGNHCNAKFEKGAVAMTGQQSLIEAIKSGQIAPGNMSSEQLAAFKDIEKVVTDLFKAVDKEMFSRISEDENSIPGYEIGEGRRSKKWAEDDEIVAKKLRGMRLKKDEVMIPTLISPAQAIKHPDLTERQLANVEKMIEMKPGPKKVVKVKQQAEKQDAAEMFEKVPELPSFM